MREALDLDALEQAYLMVGQGGVYQRPTAVRTVLGSCVSVSLFCSANKVGGIFHALLPCCRESRTGKSADPYRFVDSGVAALYKAMMRRECRRAAIEAKVFGGANVMQGGFAVGRRNVECAFATLETMGVRVVSSSIGGFAGRKLLFRTDTGDVYVKLLRQISNGSRQGK